MNMRADLTAELNGAALKAGHQGVNETTEMATETTMLAPRFYTTDFDGDGPHRRDARCARNGTR